MDEFEEKSEAFKNHKTLCRLCISRNDKKKSEIHITEDVRALIFELRLELIFTKSYSNFICDNCYQNLQQLSSFRKLVNEKQQKLSQFLCRVKNLDLSSVDIKIEDDEKSEGIEEAEDFFGFSSVSTDEEYKSEPPKPKIKPKKISKNKTEVKPKVHRDMKNPKHKQRVPCPHCGKILTYKSLINHINIVHKNKKNYFCDFCGKGVFNKSQIKFHMFNHIPDEFREKKFQCELCSKVFACERYKNLHIKHFHNPDEFKCECGKVFKHQRNLDIHKKHVHQKEKYSRTCEICGKILINSSELKKHIRIYHTDGGKGNFICPDCGKIFDELGKVNRHRMMIHEEKTFVCNETGCGKKFSSNFDLKNHRDRVHLQTKNFFCDVKNCKMAFWNNQGLVRHVKIVHEKYKAKCPVDGCDFMVGRRDAMKNHIRRHGVNSEDLQEYLDSVKGMGLL